MSIPFEQVLEEFSSESRVRIEARAAVLIAEEMTLQELRRARKLTQTRLARKLKIGQESVSRLEQRTDLHLSTLRHYVEAMGGSLSLVARFPDRAPVELTGIAMLEVGVGKPARGKRAAATTKGLSKHIPPITSRKTA